MPDTAEELAEALRRPALHDRTILLEGNGSKRRMAGPVPSTDEYVSMRGFNRILHYEPCDLTISVEAGVLWRDLREVLARHRQMVPLDPPFADSATVGGVVAANCCGPRRRLYGSARDLVIGMKFATLSGKVVSSGGMVVKNVAGLDMGKLLIGSFGTLAAIVVVNFKLLPMPEVERTFLAPFDSLREAILALDKILTGGLQPAAIDLLNPAAARMVAGDVVAAGDSYWVLAVRACGNGASVARWQRDPSFAGAFAIEGGAQDAFWKKVEEFTPGHLAAHPDGAVVRASCTLKGLERVAETFDGPAIARAGSGICYGYFERSDDAGMWMQRTAGSDWRSVIEFAGENRASLQMWPAPGGDFEIMQRVKQLFDPGNVLNRGRLYRLI
jgi:glycolate oxidase FAD binding subunit